MNDLATQDKNLPSTPGYGVAGQVMCPYGFQKGLCGKNSCELWVELYSEGQKVARCSEAWKTVIATEQSVQLKRIADMLEKMVYSNQEGKK